MGLIIEEEITMIRQIEPRPHAEAEAFISKRAKGLILKWGPRTVSALIGGYYGLGIAYDLGIMAAIDKIAILILKRFVGYVGIGVFMPTIQWYSACAVRTLSALSTSLLYNTAENTTIYVVKRFKTRHKNSHRRVPAPSNTPVFFRKTATLQKAG